MIIKQVPLFFPLVKAHEHSYPLNAGPSVQKAEPGVISLLTQQGLQADEGIDAIQVLLPVLGETTAAETGNSNFASIIASLMQLASMPMAASMSNQQESARQNELRQTVSAYAPRYGAGAFRQKIDFGSRASVSYDVAGLIKLGSVPKPAHQRISPGEDPAGHAGILQNYSSVQGTQYSEENVGESSTMPGFLAARFESLGQTDAIGYDRRGGTCYGIYQLSSRMGTMDMFLAYLEKQAPEWGARLREAGPTNTRGRSGPMPGEWRRISREDPERFARLQHEFVHKYFYEPAARAVHRRIGLAPDTVSPALREVIWSTAVQHGVAGAANIFERAASSLQSSSPDTPGARLAERDLIQAVYAERGKRFTSSSATVRSSVQQRFAEEMQLALALLPQPMDLQV